MKLYSRRIAFMISDQHFIPHGGIGSFARTFFEMCESLGWRCDYILDKKPRDSALLDWANEQSARIYYPDSPLGYSEHQSKFVFSDTLNFEKTINFRNSLMKAFESHSYDMVLINTPEAGPAAYVMDLFRYIPVVFYTHNENVVFMNSKKSDVFNDAFDDITKSMMAWPNMRVGTQSEKNVKAINKALWYSEQSGTPNERQGGLDMFASELPMRVPERGLLLDNPPWDQKHGMLFIGRHEPRKNPEAFIEAAKLTGIKPLVLTNKQGKEKFEADFAAAGITEYEIRAGIIGKEKVDFIKSARIAYHPSRLESYGFSAFETLHSCPTFALEEYDWYTAFMHHDGERMVNLVHGLRKLEVVSTLKQAYDNPAAYYKGLSPLRDMDLAASRKWEIFVQQNQKVNPEDTRETKIVQLIQEGQTSVHDLYFQGLKRKALAVDDIQSLLSKRHMYQTYHTQDNTYVGIGAFVEPETDPFNDLFG